MAGSGAGLNRVFATLLSLNSNAAAVGSPLTAYGAIGVNDSGMALNEAANFTKWTVSATGGGTGYSVTMYGTNDPKAYAAWRQGMNPGQYPGGALTLPASSWFILPGPAEETGTGQIANPLTATNPQFQFSGVLLAIRAVLTTATTPSGSFVIHVEAAP